MLYRQYLDEVSRRSSVGGTGGPSAAACAEEAGGGGEAGTPSHLQRLRKRKLRGGDSALHKRRSSVGDAVLLSLSGNLLDCTPSPDGKALLEGDLRYSKTTTTLLLQLYYPSTPFLLQKSRSL